MIKFKRIMLFDFKRVWKEIIFFTIALFLLATLLMIPTITINNRNLEQNNLFITNASFKYFKITSQGNINLLDNFQVISIAKICTYATLGAPGCLVIFVLSIYFAHLLIIKPFNTGEALWIINIPLARKKIISYKILFLIMLTIFSTVIYATPNFIFAFFSYDFKKNFLYLGYFLIQTIIINSFLLSLLLTLWVITQKKNNLVYLITGCFTFYIFTTSVFLMLEDFLPSLFQQFNFIKYIAPTSLLTNSIVSQSSLPLITEVIILNDSMWLEISSPDLSSFNWLISIVGIMIFISSSLCFNYYTILKFQKINL